jgi:phage baseplate assembly protein W
MNKAAIYGRGISFPPRIGADGRLAWSEGEDNVRESIRVILLTEQHERLMLPTFGGGLSSYLFEPNIVSTRALMAERIKKALAAWEPRISVDTIQIEPDSQDAQVAIISITYKLVATQVVERMNLSLQLK